MLAGDLFDTAGEALLRKACGPPVPVNVVRRRLSVGHDVYTIHDLTERRAVEMELQRQNCRSGRKSSGRATCCSIPR
jgi:hypothetical protein